MEEKREWNRWNGLPRAEALEAHLAEMAAGGWQLAQAGPRLRYARSAPRAAAYAVTCPPGKRERDAADTPEAWEAAGWTPVCDHGVLRIYTADLPAPPRPDGTPRARLTMVRRTMEMNNIGGIAMLVFLLAVLAAMVWTAVQKPLEFLSSLPSLLILLVWIAILAVVLLVAIPDLRWLRRAREAVDGGAPCPPLPRRRWQDAVLLVLALALAALFLAWAIEEADYFNLLLFAVIFLCQVGGRLLQRFGGTEAFLIFAVAILIVAVPVSSALPQGRDARVLPDQLPLTLADVSLPAGGNAMAVTSASPLLSYGRYRNSGGGASLEYEVCRFSLPALRALCIRALTDNGWDWQPADGPAVRTAAVEHAYGYVLADDDTVAVLYTGVETPLDDGQLAAAAAALGIS